MTLKLLLIVAVTVPAVLSFHDNDTTLEIYARWKARLAKEHPECTQATGATEGEVNQFFDLLLLSPTSTFKCFLNCMYEGFNFFTDDRSIDIDELIRDVEHVTDHMVDVCVGKYDKATEKCEKAYELAFCLTHYNNIYKVQLADDSDS
ncbi:hypothetical protein PPYR_14647 [Photinus pyralis]|uniref:Uncharacterized protein n=1 Tax=Photinus pyralis TaxID=7054 RepID=A0A5N4A600_PHOPY|nr:uncharacterized protein LOC116181085 [Photinus pyralis]KAB0792688.1 hypothetical protein PPYR_14647 [Photinus pyralis]